MTTTALPILDLKVATDHLLDARSSLTAIRDSTLPGDTLNKPVVTAIGWVDGALQVLAERVARKAAA